MKRVIIFACFAIVGCGDNRTDKQRAFDNCVARSGIPYDCAASVDLVYPENTK